ncbi:PIN domain-containing protein [Geoalkalibacter halelectricus]|uniref:PIN domain-containing protein n=1 Tax=Geoalkalibacter halelectricus TaxID=2847045 RepID=UPI003D1B4815
MTAGAVVVDTNVLVAGLLTADESCPPVRILDGMLSGAFPYLLSAALFAEYRAVLLLPPIAARHGLTVEDIDQLLEDLVAGAVWREPVAAISAPDPGDDHLWSLVACHPGTSLVTGDQLLLSNPPRGTKVMAPREFMGQWS